MMIGHLKNKLGLSWAKLSNHLGFGSTLIKICYINKKYQAEAEVVPSSSSVKVKFLKLRKS